MVKYVLMRYMVTKTCIVPLRRDWMALSLVTGAESWVGALDRSFSWAEFLIFDLDRLG